MRKPISVFSHDSNPLLDSPVFFITRFDADQRISAGYSVSISANAIQNLPPKGWTVDETNAVTSSLFDQAWSPQFSDHYIVWQMNSTDDQSERT